MKNKNEKTEKEIKIWVVIFMAGLFLSGITAFPIETELKWLMQFSIYIPQSVVAFLEMVCNAVIETNLHYPFLAYGCDWLAFAHVMLTILFVGVYRNPIKNIWVIEFGMIACICVFPLAFICGHIRHIPLYWQLIDCSFGVFGILPLLIVHKKIKQLEILHQSINH